MSQNTGKHNSESIKIFNFSGGTNPGPPGRLCCFATCNACYTNAMLVYVVDSDQIIHLFNFLLTALEIIQNIGVLLRASYK